MGGWLQLHMDRSSRMSFPEVTPDSCGISRVQWGFGGSGGSFGLVIPTVSTGSLLQ